jgi:hypothetical protein
MTPSITRAQCGHPESVSVYPVGGCHHLDPTGALCEPREWN